jgi:hypothetical protein
MGMSITLNDRADILKRLYNDDQDIWVEAQADAIELIEKQGDELDKLNSVMHCGHLGRYQFEEDGTQYCSMCERDDLIEVVEIIGQILQHINDFRDIKREARHEQ